MIAPETTVVRSSDVLSVDLDGETVILDIGSGTYFSLGDVGSDVWNRLADPISAEDLAVMLIRDYDGPPEKIRADLLDLLTD
ncbi:PqqD family protein, partial [Acinetobacter baumannii]